MAARLCPDNVRQTHQSLHHIVADAPWKDDDMLETVRRYVVPAMEEQGPIVAWIVDDTGFLKKGTHSVGVARQYCGQVGKQENCQVAVSLSISTMKASLPIAWRLYLPELWTQDRERRKATSIPEEIGFQTKPGIALQQIRTAVDRQIPSAPVLADAGYGNDAKFREGISEAGLLYVVGVQSSLTVWKPGQGPLPKRKWNGMVRPTKLLGRDRRHQPVSARTFGEGLASLGLEERGLA
jgi:SRSO17 transposase